MQLFGCRRNARHAELIKMRHCHHPGRIGEIDDEGNGSDGGYFGQMKFHAAMIS